jgi:hypothetical protein
MARAVHEVQHLDTALAAKQKGCELLAALSEIRVRSAD